MPVPLRAERLAFFVYQDRIWSAGDRLHVTFEFASDAALRAGLAPLSLDWLADAELLEERIPVLDAFEVDADVFGNVVTLTLGPEDKYEHLGAEDYDRAEALETRFHAAGLLPHLGDRLHLVDWAFPASPLSPPPSAPGPPRFLVAILEPAPEGWIVHVRERLGGQLLEGAGDPRRFLPARLRTRPEVGMYLLLTEAQRRALVSAGERGAPALGDVTGVDPVS